MAPRACAFKVGVRHVVHSTDLSCRKVSFRVAPHGEIVIDIKKKKSKEATQISELFASFGLQDDLTALNHVSCAVSLRPDGCRAR